MDADDSNIVGAESNLPSSDGVEGAVEGDGEELHTSAVVHEDEGERMDPAANSDNSPDGTPPGSPGVEDDGVDQVDTQRQVDDKPSELKVGDRVNIPREQRNLPCVASIVTFKEGGKTAVVYDDMMWAGFNTQEVEEWFRSGRLPRVTEEQDVPICQRARAFLCPFNGAPPDLFLFDERVLPSNQAGGWRWFGRLVPAPPNGTHGQKYSTPRFAKEMNAGCRVALCGRITRLQPLKRGEPKEMLNTSTEFTVLGFVQGQLASQKSNWLIVSSMKGEVSDSSHIYVATAFGRAAEDIHVTILNDGARVMHDGLKASVEEAMVRCYCPSCFNHLSWTHALSCTVCVLYRCCSRRVQPSK